MVESGQDGFRRLAGRRAIVTGGGSGIGEASCRRMAAEGARVLVVDRDAARAEVVAGAIVSGGADAVAFGADVSREDDVRAMVDAALDHFGGLDILVNNAAATDPGTIGIDTTLTEMTLDLWNRTLAVNLTGPMLGCRYAVPVMVDQGGGAIVNVASIAGLIGDLQYTAYAASKAGLLSLTQNVATQYGRFGVRCNAVAPGVVLTEASQRTMTDADRAARVRHNLTPMIADATQIAPLVAFLASDEAAYITGEVVRIDGGSLSHAPGYAHRLEASGS